MRQHYYLSTTRPLTAEETEAPKAVAIEDHTSYMEKMKLKPGSLTLPLKNYDIDGITDTLLLGAKAWTGKWWLVGNSQINSTLVMVGVVCLIGIFFNLR